MRAVVLDVEGLPELATVDEPGGLGELLRVRACGLCGSDVEKVGKAPAGTVLGHEVVAETSAGARVALVHHLPCGECARCRAGHESTCDAFCDATIVPGGFADCVRGRDWVELPESVGDALGTYAEPLACVLRGAERLPRGRVLIVGHGFVGRLFAEVLRWRGETVFAVDPRPDRGRAAPDGPVDAAVLCAPAGAEDAVEALEPGGTLLVFADSGQLALEAVYRRELNVVGSRSATPRHLRAAVELLPELELPAPTVLPLERFAEGLALYRRGEVLKVVFTP